MRSHILLMMLLAATGLAQNSTAVDTNLAVEWTTAAAALLKAGNLTGAESLYRRALGVLTKSLDPDDPRIATATRAGRQRARRRR